ncbi:hypothetical protein ACN23B_10725 [Anabaena sp. FACHB-709]|uniref:Uncharacterized protein n=2 Tax=Nostocaceae TaxID=1162 RepID=A0A1Z4KFK5_ANAVA|nr:MULTISPECIES: hypothetical protein [Nostocaceae]BAY67760.1 hypothetical protein NIES23_05420 [Trichormus variabilis NIES-23]MBD2170144.1 hypothetical protein [Anabaena cylindrica FACHB-318]MBD2265967.1 hypothetical protein [Anabaena sp. FACHB-709]MBD2275344.1 hypothetical protein [Nostoc sp. PCC 7120 = FACHB-418]MBD2286335.1 hypothetical protein [Anabaena cylindrica FACHB-170]
MVKQQSVDEQANGKATSNLTPAQKFLQELWDEHLRLEFDAHNTEDTLATMVEDAYVNGIPVMIGGVGKPALPVVGVDSARKVLDPSLPSNALIDRASDRN